MHWNSIISKCMQCPLKDGNIDCTDIHTWMWSNCHWLWLILFLLYRIMKAYSTNMNLFSPPCLCRPWCLSTLIPFIHVKIISLFYPNSTTTTSFGSSFQIFTTLHMENLSPEISFKYLLSHFFLSVPLYPEDYWSQQWIEGERILKIFSLMHQVLPLYASPLILVSWTFYTPAGGNRFLALNSHV